MGKIVGVQFQKNGKMYYFETNGFDAKPGDFVIVDTARGNDLGEVIMGAREADDKLLQTPLKKIVRIASDQDIQHGIDNREKEKEAFSICQQKIAEHKLEMKLVSVEYAFDNSKILFFFTANGRVDFRALVKDLASIFKVRIELRQIGVRDEAKMLGGLGPCGRTICCGSFLEQFQPVSIKMAKEQNLSLNPTKISGVCGRLMCCLKYEQDHYEQTRKKMPKVGKTVITPDGSGPVTDLNIVKETVFVRLVDGDSSEIKEYQLETINCPESSSQSDTVIKNDTKDRLPVSSVKKATQTVSFTTESDISTIIDDDMDYKSSEERVNNNGKTRNRQKSKAQRNQQLGQPVRRENPNRTSSTVRIREEMKTTNITPKEVVESQNSQAQTNTPWADALQRAMQAIHSDN